MKYSLTFEVIAPPEAPVLLEVVAALREYRLRPDALVWSIIAGSQEARLWLDLDTEKTLLVAFTDAFRSHPAIKRLIVAENGRSPQSLAPPIAP